MNIKRVVFLLSLIFGLSPAILGQNQAPNTLTEAEKADGWELLFDGKSLDGWRKYRGGEPGSNWQIDQGALYYSKNGGKGGDIITNQSYENFELSLEWKIDRGSNSGIIYHVVESEEYNSVWNTGPEMQILDDKRHHDGRIVKHRAGDLYDLIESSKPMAKKPGKWNKVRIVSVDGQVQHWLNGEKIVEYDMNQPEWAELIADSKFAKMPGFGKAKGGHIALQDHGDPVWFRNIKIRQRSEL